MSVFGFDILASSVVLGIVNGATYSLLALGLVLVYRSTKVVNFAHGQLGALGAYLLAKLVLDYDVPYLLALAVVLIGGAAVGALIELGVVRRLRDAPRLILLVATIGVSQILLVTQLLLPSVEGGNTYPVAFDRRAEAFGIVFNGATFLVLGLVPGVVLTLTYFLTRTPYGRAIQASAENPEAARLAQVRVKRVSTLVWALAGGLAVLTASLNLPVSNTAVNLPAESLGATLLLKALVAAMIGGFVSLPLTFAGGIAVGVVEAVVLTNTPTSPGTANLVFFIVILALLLFRRIRSLGNDGTPASVKVPPVAEALRQLWWVRHLTSLAYGALLVAALAAPLIVTSSEGRFGLTRLVIFALPCLSLTVLTGWGGQLSLGQFAFVGVGAFAAGGLTLRGVPLPMAIVMGTVITAAVAVIAGLPALRLKGLFVAISTLAFAVMANQWLFDLPFLKGDGTLPQFARTGPWTSSLTYYYLCLGGLVVGVLVVAALRRSGSGRLLLATRDNENGTSAFSVSPRTVKVQAFALAGALAGLGGGLYGGLVIRFNAGDFAPSLSLTLVSTVIIGGLGTIAGAVLGPLWVIGLPQLFGGSAEATLAASGIGLLIFLLYFPNGLVALPLAARQALLDLAARRLGDKATDVPPLPRQRLTAEDRAPAPAEVPALLRAEHVKMMFGGRVALEDVSIEVRQDEVLGLIGSNGAGKSTLMNIISGFLVPTAGRLVLDGQDITALPPHERAALGLGRAFQDARLFPGLTVQECVEVAGERLSHSEFVPDLLALPPSRAGSRARRAHAEDLMGLLGLGRYRNAYISELSTGTRRIAELACLVALQPRVLLLDEPTAGVAQKETELFGPLIRSIKGELGASVVIIEHDMPLVTRMSDRLYCLGSGVVLAEGLPHDVTSDPAVVAAYLGTDERAINRSGAAAPGALPKSPASVAPASAARTRRATGASHDTTARPATSGPRATRTEPSA
jgi:ABC-type branched-subunit amino acid transport system ATPase component/ABC-type branched-subunit amino acid transport system permease subunit